jgi:hypothetical protein
MYKFIKMSLFTLFIISIFVINGCSSITTTNNNLSTKITTSPGDIVNEISPMFTEFNLNEMIINSDAIVTGIVVNILPSQKGLDPVMFSKTVPAIYTDVIIKVNSTLYGINENKDIGVRLLGGRIGNEVMLSSEGEFTVGENVLVFLFKEKNYEMTPAPSNINTQDYYKVVRLFQGKFQLAGDTATNSEGVKLSVKEIQNRIQSVLR